jgi:phage terminase small subunit
MPARKPSVLITRSETKADSAARTAGESAVTPKTQLTLATPPLLHRGHAVAAATWKRIVGLYLEVDGVVATAFDSDLLIKYCLLEEEVREMALDRKKMRSQWELQLAAAKKVPCDSENLKTWAHMWEVVNALFMRYQGMDARLDGKRKLLLSLSQSLYLTPRSRAGVEPPTKEPEHEQDDMEKLLDEE